GSSTSSASVRRDAGSREADARSSRATSCSRASTDGTADPASPPLSPPEPGGDKGGEVGSLPGFHLMLQPTLGFCSVGAGWPVSTAFSAARRSAPVTGLSLSGRLSSYWPR